ncbi:hypothetical protein M0R88_14795 [Halorussus gelatinilyticus]|uniref:DUF7344 domain-containing protein n=1 Tax=Halorussus gelatinilyticus TaxID=2937524 RepID=A0A8U0IGB8_9EURY|nr:hypothetical protein [Halorussus gelatinilyticus]UPV99774.1 hypothetical protein M0R88_14795 [Halorussus gelatinilyticus]
MVGTPELDTLLDVCEHKHRRIVLAALTDQHQSLSINDLTNAIVKHNHHTLPTEASDEIVTQIQTDLHHVHLPKLSEAGLIHYDPERKVVEPTAQLDQEGSHLSAILAIDSKLPTP